MLGTVLTAHSAIMGVEQCSFIILKYVIRMIAASGRGWNCTCIIQLGNPFSEKVDRWLDNQHAFAVQAFKSNDPVMAAEWIPEEVHDRNGVKN